MQRSVITGTGSYIPSVIQSNERFLGQTFYAEDNKPIPSPAAEIIRKFKLITGIDERRYVPDNLTAADIGTFAAEEAIKDSGIDREQIDQLIVAHNFGNVIKHTIQTDAVPALASVVKHQLKIRSAACIAYDILFGCPGWLQALIQADAFFKAGVAKTALIIGTETLSRVIDMYDRDSMIFSDGAGAAIVEYKPSADNGPGVLSASAQNHTTEEVNYINMRMSYHPDSDPNVRYIKMKGRKVYEYAMTYVPLAIKDCLDKSGADIRQLRKIFIHQANEKMDLGIIERLYRLYGIDKPPGDIMPMSIHWLGNSSVATVPTLYDLVRKQKVEGHALHAGDIIVFASVGAGMSINAVCYRY